MESKVHCSWPLLLLLLMLALGRVRPENINDTTASEDIDDDEATSPSPSIPETTDRLITGDLRKAARVEQLSPPGSGSASKQEYDVIDVLSATNAVVGKAKSGQTTRIYTTGEVDDTFWMKHLGDDFKHAIHLQVGGTNEEYNRLVNQTQNGIHEEVHHEYLPGAERPDSMQQQPRARYTQRSSPRQQQGLEGEALAMKQRYLIHQQQQQQQRYGYTQQHAQQYTPRAHTQIHQYPHPHTHQHTHQQQPHTHRYQRPYPRPKAQQQQPQQQQQVRYINHRPPIRTIINSSEDQLHAAQSSPGAQHAAAAAIQAGGGIGRSPDEDESDTFGSQLPFKSPFNDYGSRPTRDLTYLLYRRGL
ncbi:putative mediator of RNA polymerase II transcription subunit 26 [Drosophila miranda]|uniref:putative mediator of RNA polymerase II transcription subunit 26 n=1 Tax=Drosophila miranda TaxID=7229 RepID=UPI0007E6D160|nr:putative mediator of RNA polymerase II transcription subunit 26 [Drosophila miranda]